MTGRPRVMVLFIPRQRILARGEQIFIERLMYEAEGGNLIWFYGRALVATLPDAAIPVALRNLGTFYTATERRRLDDLVLGCPDLEMAVGTFKLAAERRVAIHHDPAAN